LTLAAVKKSSTDKRRMKTKNKIFHKNLLTKLLDLAVKCGKSRINSKKKRNSKAKKN